MSFFREMKQFDTDSGFIYSFQVVKPVTVNMQQNMQLYGI